VEAVSYAPVRPAVYAVAVPYDAAADCGGAHYVWDDYVGGWVYRPYTFPC
jgi:hypothetical protein